MVSSPSVSGFRDFAFAFTVFTDYLAVSEQIRDTKYGAYQSSSLGINPLHDLEMLVEDLNN